MSLGERIKLARRRAGLSQRDLASRVSVTAAAISKYELGKDVPSSGVLLRLAKALGVRVAFFFQQPSVVLTPALYREHSRLRQKDRNAALASVQECVERYLAVEELLGGIVHADLPEAKHRPSSLDDVERVAAELRERWALGEDPIENVTELFEEKGIKVVLLPAYRKFDALTVWANGATPVIAVNRNLPGDRQRFNLCHELGHLVLAPSKKVDEEHAAHRFAGAFLVPDVAARAALGAKRSTIAFQELQLLKQRFGLSMQAWVYRAKDLGIITDSLAARIFRTFSSRGWRNTEPGTPCPSERPQRMQRMVLHALAEDIIGDSRAAELLGESLAEFRQHVREPFDDTFIAGRR